MRNELGVPAVVDRKIFQAGLDALRVREKAHTRESDAIAAARRRLPMVEMDSATRLISERGAVTLLDAFEGRQLLIADHFMWHTGHPAAEQCEGCTLYTSQVRELSFLHSRDLTYATFCQGRTKRASVPRFHGLEMPWYSAQGRSTLSWLDAGWSRCRLFATCDKDRVSSRLTGRRGAALRRWEQLRFARHDGLRAAGDVGGLADRLAATVGWQAASLPYRWTSHRPVAPPEGRAFRRSGPA